jgi:hypothetical protein
MMTPMLRGSTELIHHPAERRMLPVLDFDPAIKPAGAIGAIAVLRDQTLQPIRQAWRNRSEPISPCSKGARWMPTIDPSGAVFAPPRVCPIALIFGRRII